MSSLVNIQSLITFLKKQIKVDMNTEINKIKNEYQTKINQLNSQISELSKSNGTIHILNKYTFSGSGGLAYNYTTNTINTSSIDKSYKNYYIILGSGGGNNVCYEGISSISNVEAELGNVRIVNDNLKTWDNRPVGCANTTRVYKVIDIDQNIVLTIRGLVTVMLIGI